MALIDNPPLINGEAYDYASIVMVVAGVPVTGVTEITYEDTQEVTDNYGTGRFPVSRGFGPIEATASITIERGELNALLNAAPGQRLQDIAEFDIEINYAPRNSPIVTDVLRNVRFTNTQGGASQGDSNVTATLTIKPSHIDWNN